MKGFFDFMRRRKFLCSSLILFLIYIVFFDAFQERTLRTYLGSRIYVFFQDLSPEEAKKMVVQDANKNPQFMNNNNDRIWTHMFVYGDEYFFPVRWPKGSIDEEGYYINPKTRKIKYVKGDYVFVFPFFHEMSSIRLHACNENIPLVCLSRESSLLF